MAGRVVSLAWTGTASAKLTVRFVRMHVQNPVPVRLAMGPDRKRSRANSSQQPDAWIVPNAWIVPTGASAVSSKRLRPSSLRHLG
jgi:hypothetical protein